MTGERCRPRDVRAGYEELRAWATGERAGTTAPRGLTLLLRHGLPGWMEAWSLLPAGRSGKTLPPRESAMPGTHPAASTELTMVLAQMAFSAVRS